MILKKVGKMLLFLLETNPVFHCSSSPERARQLAKE